MKQIIKESGRVVCLSGLLMLSTAYASSDIVEYGEWGAPENLGTVVNTTKRDGCQYVSKDGLSLYLASDRDTGSDMDLYVAERSSTNEPFGAPVALNINAAGADDVCPALSHDGHVLYFATAREGGCGDRDIWMTRRYDKRDNFNWSEPVHLGCTVNSAKVDQGPSYYEDRYNKYIVFSSNRPSNDSRFAGHDIYKMQLFDDGTPDESTVEIIEELSTMANDHRPFIRKDGLEVVFDSNRQGSGQNDLYSASRKSRKEPFSVPLHLINLRSTGQDVRAVMNRDGTELYFTSNREGTTGSIDVWVSKREKERDHSKGRDD